ncbi:MAG: quercetin 2,3-dioxygenase [Gallionellales bacterium 35-53-114]|jgi:redox-sensitive bicupin YhaK (pirin superfamily)|nr:MAG: quercetin 2,3-dioxygenase [Gallionellales bacterium 35-53-114]OYZ62789.1 MAG: quercetin 2,3-dioxygenase [Gallionellales bacterium 24-53-125]OZB09865.1 MAG: quercetin 2,3-dioxygenase [Gallionellales bacterium 39-52-133]HQS57568.1 pirin family protein [Gallionellaceae bacterium]HQS74022.1 pirin family protein [Gallionellaceae bacterium]
MKKIKSILPASTRNHWVGDGFNVRPVFGPLAFTRDISPFLMFDYAAPREFSATTDKLGVGPHPHRGFETVTIALQGEVEHGDSVGNRGVIGPGDVQWMTAASGIIHEEFLSHEFLKRGGTLEMVQLWVNLPAKDKMNAPKYQAILSGDIPVVALPENAGSVRVIAGDFAGTKGVASTHSPVNLWEITVKAGSSLALPVPGGHNAMLFVRSGKLAMEKVLINQGDLVLLEAAGANIGLQAQEDSSVLLMGGEPIDEPVVASGPFVMNTEQEIRRAMMDYQSGRMGQIAG